jgi:hypothetical protein
MSGVNGVVGFRVATPDSRTLSDSQIPSVLNLVLTIDYLRARQAQQAQRSSSQSNTSAAKLQPELPSFCEEELAVYNPPIKVTDIQGLFTFTLKRDPTPFFTIANNGYAPTVGKAKTLEFFDQTKTLHMTIVEQVYQEPVVHGNTIQLIECPNGTLVPEERLAIYTLSSGDRVVVMNADELTVQFVSSKDSALAPHQR